MSNYSVNLREQSYGYDLEVIERKGKVVITNTISLSADQVKTLAELCNRALRERIGDERTAHQLHGLD